MAEQTHHAHDIPQMDYPEHQRTYTGFVHLAEVATATVLSHVAALAVGNQGAWGTAIFLTIVTLICAGIGIASPKIGWRAPAVPLVLLLIAMAIL